MTKLYAVGNALQVGKPHELLNVAFCQSQVWAEIIANAVNTQEELVRALESVLTWLDGEVLDDDDRDIHGVTQEERAENISDMIKQALAKAKGEV